MNLDKNTILVIALVVLFLFAGVQAIQLSVIKNQIAEGGFTTGGSSLGTSVSSGSSTASGSSSLDSLPSMVGGC
ncbi:hypothetical protein COV16_06945 [Candidatus Woesearchaeota archaeon CG10_big_fil_rev_8_21_14_0_10_34_8]|nr:MAG: hypothetical protein COV16_06945 [Candidatus Woesearchaeota archaeon CG10_big_fil_rev_8_21_14_0_10_34_8]